MVAERKHWHGKRGPIPKDDAKVSPKTLRNRRSLAASSVKRYGLSPLQLRASKAEVDDIPAPRKRAPPGTPEVVLEALLARRAKNSTWEGFKAARGGKAVYKNKIIAMEKALTSDLAVSTTRHGAFLNGFTAIPLYLHLAQQSHVLHQGDYPPGLLIFWDANSMYAGKKCHLLSISLPQAKQPHQLGLQLPLGRWNGPENHSAVWKVFESMNLVHALKSAMQIHMHGKRLRLVWSPDWAALRTILNHAPPGSELGCVFCWSMKTNWRLFGGPKGPLRVFENFDTRCRPFLDLFASMLDIIYDPLHCCALVLTHMVVHAIYFWVQQNLPAAYQAQLLGVYKTHLLQHPFFAAESVKIGPNDWAMSNNLTKSVLFNCTFWADLSTLLPRTTQGLVVQHQLVDGGAILDDPLHEYLQLLRALAVQLLAWKPLNVATRQADCARLHALHSALGFPKERFTIAFHVFLEHYGDRLERHGNLQGMCTEGGEHSHQRDAQIVATRKSTPAHKCPIGLECCMQDAALGLGLWRNGFWVPANYYEDAVSLPPK